MATNAAENKTLEQKRFFRASMTFSLSLAYAAMAQPLHRGIRCCVEGSETTFELVYRADVDDVRHGLGGSTDAQLVVGITPLASRPLLGSETAFL